MAATVAGGLNSLQGGLVDGIPSLVWAPAGHLRGVIDLTVMDGRITVLTAVADPAHLDRLELVIDD